MQYSGIQFPVSKRFFIGSNNNNNINNNNNNDNNNNNNNNIIIMNDYYFDYYKILLKVQFLHSSNKCVGVALEIASAGNNTLQMYIRYITGVGLFVPEGSETMTYN